MSARISANVVVHDDEELQWLFDRGVQIDRKGRIIISLPAPDENEYAAENRESSIAELMRREVITRGGSRGRRRRSSPKAASRGNERAPFSAASASRVGRPAIGGEVRVYVHTSIARTTRETLSQRGLTLAQVFNECALELTREA